MWAVLISFVAGVLVGLALAVPYWRRQLRGLHAQWIMFCDQVVNEKIAEFFGGHRTPDGGVIIPVHVVKPPKSDGETN